MEIAIVVLREMIKTRASSLELRDLRRNKSAPTSVIASISLEPTANPSITPAQAGLLETKAKKATVTRNIGTKSVDPSMSMERVGKGEMRYAATTKEKRSCTLT
jgi:hypothetical protein